MFCSANRESYQRASRLSNGAGVTNAAGDSDNKVLLLSSYSVNQSHREEGGNVIYNGNSAGVVAESNRACTEYSFEAPKTRRKTLEYHFEPTSVCLIYSN